MTTWDTFDAAWEIIAAPGCPVCKPLNERVLPTLADLYRVMPDFGPVDGCPDEDACACRAVPTRRSVPPSPAGSPAG